MKEVIIVVTFSKIGHKKAGDLVGESLIIYDEPNKFGVFAVSNDRAFYLSNGSFEIIGEL